MSYNCGVLKKFDVVVDCRTHPEWIQGHISRAVFMPITSLYYDADQLSKDQKIGIYCRSGSRSQMAVNFLKENGYEDVTNLGSISQFIGCIEY